MWFCISSSSSSFSVSEFQLLCVFCFFVFSFIGVAGRLRGEGKYGDFVIFCKVSFSVSCNVSFWRCLDFWDLVYIVVFLSSICILEKA